jgi:hypothetical protein
MRGSLMSLSSRLWPLRVIPSRHCPSPGTARLPPITAFGPRMTEAGR